MTNGLSFCSVVTNALADTPHQAVYEIHSVSLNDEGSYICHAINEAGSSEERVYIRVEDPITVREKKLIL